MFFMSAGHRSTSMTGFVAEAPDNQDVSARHPVQAARTLLESLDHSGANSDHPGANEVELRRRARRQALALMIASSVLSMLAIYGLWTLLRAVI